MATLLPARDDRPIAGAGLSGVWPGVVSDPATGPAAWAAFAERLPVIRAGIATLRDLQPADAGPLAGTLGDPEVARFIAPPPPTPGAFEQFIDWAHSRRRAADCLCFGVAPDGSDHAVGMFQLRRLNASGQFAEWGFVMGRAYWGSGLFDTCAHALLQFAFETLEVHRLEATIPLANTRAHSVIRRLGAIQTGFVTSRVVEGAPLVEGTVWTLTPRDWRETRSRASAS
jgi:ribosomal-protein-alanine N-acetyltransferase